VFESLHGATGPQGRAQQINRLSCLTLRTGWSGRQRRPFPGSLLYCTVFAAVALEIAVRLIKTLVVLLIILVMTLIWLTRPGPVDAVGWDVPAPPPATGALMENTDLRQAALLGQGMLNGPE